ncbi:hypothetical protein G3480_14820 [Thiorhodococcus mannitoliphagus]|uniref:Uncharacterized protein n=1 Tax=Thiorhodococcus mannitoliphagus TaxID=329406 RepID=A0A6P1DTB9_9GAMM|nr:hypothetical protein [Thiorhodococcus mannitoliphagus]NEX21567.1 hypothetical protein [Thiorhodococcus mannitoliphagus]
MSLCALRWGFALAGLLGALLSGCDRPKTPVSPQSDVAVGQPIRVIAGDSLSLEIRRIKDLLLADQVVEAQHALLSLKGSRATLPAERQVEIDRLEALFAAVR